MNRTSAVKKGPRNHEIDGIRGWAAFSVLLFHMFEETFKTIHASAFGPEYWLFIDGAVAVYVFFILSGDAISTSFIATNSTALIDRSTIRRYFRLTVPIFLSSIITLLILMFKLNANTQAASVVHNPWLAGFLNFDASITGFLKFTLLGVFGFADISHCNYNEFLWTMPIELMGSFLVLLYLYLLPSLKFKIRTSVVLTMLALSLGSYYGLFFLGVTLAQLRQTGVIEKLKNQNWVRLSAILLFLACYSIEYFAHSNFLPNSTIVRPLYAKLAEHYRVPIAVGLIFSFYFSVDACRFFSSKVSQFLGRNSFSIYLIQFPVLVSVTSFLILHYASSLQSFSTVWIIGLASVAVTVLTSEFFTRVELRALKWVYQKVDQLRINRS